MAPASMPEFVTHKGSGSTQSTYSFCNATSTSLDNVEDKKVAANAFTRSPSIVTGLSDRVDTRRREPRRLR